MPGIETSMPKPPDRIPFRKEPSDSEAMNTSAISTRAKFSNGPNLSPNQTSGGESSTSATQDRTPPTSDAATPRPMARPGRPPRAMG